MPPPPPLSALQSEAFTEPTATDARRHVIATEFLKECAAFGVDVRYMCAHAVVIGRSRIVGGPLAQALLERDATAPPHVMHAPATAPGVPATTPCVPAAAPRG